jgi:hypothetical protein
LDEGLENFYSSSKRDQFNHDETDGISSLHGRYFMLIRVYNINEGTHEKRRGSINPFHQTGRKL